ncbi:MAG TPA: GNAT family N-acetyltransferase, partial [Bdellovibrionales bacterium]|nr:GNAT family N-acetyltransferase [Bdellovibrionales bacterium]
ENDPWEFYSWLGGVLPEYRGLGVASALMRAQHEWCAQNGYARILTKTQNRWREMLLLNIRHGFDVIGTYQSSRHGLKILLEKKLG